jgi:hypothetical protein
LPQKKVVNFFEKKKNFKLTIFKGVLLSGPTFFWLRIISKNFPVKKRGVRQERERESSKHIRVGEKDTLTQKEREMREERIGDILKARKNLR